MDGTRSWRAPNVDGLLINTAKVAAALAEFIAAKPSIESPEELKLHLLALARATFAGDPNLPAAASFLESLFSSQPGAVAEPPVAGRDALFAGNMLTLRPVILSAGNIRPTSHPVSVLGEEQDILAEGPTEWSVFRVLNLALMASIPARKRVAIVTSVRNEGVSILEWLAHHRASGFEDFYVYTNDNTDGSDELLQNLADFGIIRLINNKVGKNVKIQQKILAHSLQLLPELRDFEWVFYIDVDEFFISRCEPGLTLDSFFAHFGAAFPADPPSAISLNWKWFGSENAFEVTDGLLLERFQHSIHNEHVKSLVKIRDVVSMHRVHTPVLVTGAYLIDSNFDRVEPAITMKPTYGKAQLNHYWNKSFQEFVLKRSRGRISQGLDGKLLDFSVFFDWGANGKRGNFDPPPGAIISRAAEDYNILLSIPRVAETQSMVSAHNRAAYAALNDELDLVAIYQRRGQVLD